MSGFFRKIFTDLHWRKGQLVATSNAPAESASKTSSTMGKMPGSDVTGQTIFRDHALRLKSLTPAEGEGAPSLEDTLESAFKIRVAKYTGTRRESKNLVENRYSGRGYQIPAQKQDPNLSTFVAYDEGQLVGTIAVRLDSEHGLSADELYREEIGILRKKGHRVFEFTRLAVDSNAMSKAVLAGLFHTAYLYAAVVRGYTHAVIEVNPRHANYYCRALKFEQLGPERLNTRVNAPAVLLCVPMDVIAEGILLYAGKPDEPGGKKTLFPYGFPPAEEAGVLNRLRSLVEQA